MCVRWMNCCNPSCCSEDVTEAELTQQRPEGRKCGAQPSTPATLDPQRVFPDAQGDIRAKMTEFNSQPGILDALKGFAAAVDWTVNPCPARDTQFELFPPRLLHTNMILEPRRRRSQPQ